MKVQQTSTHLLTTSWLPKQSISWHLFLFSEENNIGAACSESRHLPATNYIHSRMASRISLNQRTFPFRICLRTANHWGSIDNYL
jgi:hypothetical protein